MITQTTMFGRYLLYDVKPGEGFNLQKEIFIRAATTVALLNEGRDEVREVGSINFS